MSLSLYGVTIPAFQQTLGAVAVLLEKTEVFCAEKGIPTSDIVTARLAEDMLPFAYQVKSVAIHSLGAIEGVRRGGFSPDETPPPADLAGLKARIAATLTALGALTPTEVDGFFGRDVRFTFGERFVDYTAENFLLSFSLPNFYFHATTAYDILRWKGLPVGKRDYLGRTRAKKRA